MAVKGTLGFPKQLLLAFPAKHAAVEFDHLRVSARRYRVMVRGPGGHSYLDFGLGKALQYTGSTGSNATLINGIPAITIDGGGHAGNLHSMEEWFEPANAWKGIRAHFTRIRSPM